MDQETVLRGVRIVGNEFNIISGRPYITKEGFSRLVREWPGLTELRLMPGVPATQANRALIAYRAVKKGSPPTPAMAIEEGRLIKETVSSSRPATPIGPSGTVAAPTEGRR